MCGVIGLTYERLRADLGLIAAELLRTLEYRGYDSTGAAIQGLGEEVTLRKGVGAPSAMVYSLGIVELGGQILCGQVRWATFGAVTDANSQPHVVRCKSYLYGAHNGNVTNCDALKAWLTSEGHRVLSDNDGEMVVHTIEHCFARALDERPVAERHDTQVRRQVMREAIVVAATRLEGSYSAVMVDPVSRALWAIKHGSSLYFGVGTDATGGRFAIASSDLSSVLKLTRVVVPMREGEFVEFDGGGHHQLYSVRDQVTPTSEGTRLVKAGEAFPRSPVRSRLRAKDTALSPPYKTFMEQEIAAQEDTCRAVVRLFFEGVTHTFEGVTHPSKSFEGVTHPSHALHAPHQPSDSTSPHQTAPAPNVSALLRTMIGTHPPGELERIANRLDSLRDQYDDAHIRASFHLLSDTPEMRGLLARVPRDLAERATEGIVGGTADRLAEHLLSSESGFLADLLPMARDRADLVAVRLLDALLAREELGEFTGAVDKFLEFALQSLAVGGRLFCVCCGSSYNAARAGALFFNEMARTELVPLLPGEFRERVSHTLRDGDLIVAVSQSGETKDLIDIMNDVAATGRAIRRIAVVNNVNSTLAEEKSDLVIPLRCGPEVAVPATKSFMNQLAVLYGLALRLGERRMGQIHWGEKERETWTDELRRRRERFPSLPALLRATVSATDEALEEAAQLLYLKSSIHLLAIRLTALAREGALKIREVVLNHAEGFEGSEFKHGPNTILGYNTIAGPREVDALLRKVGQITDGLVREVMARGLPADSAHRLIEAVSDTVFAHSPTPFSLSPEERALFDQAMAGHELARELYSDYPLLYLTGPDERDVNLTVSQINTHKIRGSSTIVIAEESPALRGAAAKPPVDNPRYRSVYVALPRTDDILMTVFSATVALQRLALKMSLLKMQYLDRLGVKEHGVHPDVPKNVSKSITVD